MPFDGLIEAVAAADVVVTATAALEPVLGVEAVQTAVQSRSADRPGPLVILDLAVPRDVAPAVGRPARRHA